jgi:hypothetical protein
MMMRKSSALCVNHSLPLLLLRSTRYPLLPLQHFQTSVRPPLCFPLPSWPAFRPPLPLLPPRACVADRSFVFSSALFAAYRLSDLPGIPCCCDTASAAFSNLRAPSSVFPSAFVASFPSSATSFAPSGPCR